MDAHRVLPIHLPYKSTINIGKYYQVPWILWDVSLQHGSNMDPKGVPHILKPRPVVPAPQASPATVRCRVGM